MIKGRFYFSHVLLSFFTFTILFTSNLAHALYVQFCPYAGADFKYTLTQGKHQFKNAISENYPGGTAYAGTKLSENFGVEVGYNRTSEVHRSQLINAIPLKTGVRFTSFYFDINGFLPLRRFLPLYRCWELIGSLGVESAKARVNQLNLNTGILTNFPNATKTIIRAGLGAQYIYTPCVAFRGLVRWEDTHQLKINDQSFLKASVSFAIGVFYIF